MWRIGQLAQMTGVSERTLRHYDRIGILRPATVDRTNGYRWYGAPELTRLERIRALQQLGLPLRLVADVIDATASDLNHAVAENVIAVRERIAALTDTAAVAERHLAAGDDLLPQRTRTGPRRLRVRHLRVGDPTELAAFCESPPHALLTWLDRTPSAGFHVAVSDEHANEILTLPARVVVRTVVREDGTVVDAGRRLFSWMDRHGLVPSGATFEQHLTDGDGATVTVLEIPVLSAT